MSGVGQIIVKKFSLLVDGVVFFVGWALRAHRII